MASYRVRDGERLCEGESIAPVASRRIAAGATRGHPSYRTFVCVFLVLYLCFTHLVPMHFVQNAGDTSTGHDRWNEPPPPRARPPRRSLGRGCRESFDRRAFASFPVARAPREGAGGRGSEMGRLVKLLGVEGGGTTWIARAITIDVEGGDTVSSSKSVQSATYAEDVQRVEAHFQTTTPEATLGEIREWIEAHAWDAEAIGVATFGPVELDVMDDQYGYITTTPKAGWENTDVLGALFGPQDEAGAKAWRATARLKTVDDVPLAFDTDVNAPALLEHSSLRRELKRLGRHGGESCCYATVGTGVGVGVVAGGDPIHGMLHPEAGHMHVKMLPGETFEGCCPFHGNCVEGMVGSGALAKRRGIEASQLAELPDDDEIWDYAAHYLAGLCVNLILTVSPERIVLGGGVMQRACLFDKIRTKVREILAGYVNTEEITNDTNFRHYIVPPAWGYETGINGALYLAENALKRH